MSATLEDSEGQELHHGETTLHIASFKGNLEVVKYLADRGADIDKGDEVREYHVMITIICIHLSHYYDCE